MSLHTFQPHLSSSKPAILTLHRIQRMSLHAFQPHLSSSKPYLIIINTCHGTLRLDVQPDAMFDRNIHPKHVIITSLDNYLELLSFIRVAFMVRRSTACANFTTSSGHSIRNCWIIRIDDDDDDILTDSYIRNYYPIYIYICATQPI